MSPEQRIAELEAEVARLVEEREQYGCVVVKWSSRICARGTRSCNREHEVIPVELHRTRLAALEAERDEARAMPGEAHRAALETQQQRIAVLETENARLREMYETVVEGRQDFRLLLGVREPMSLTIESNKKTGDELLDAMLAIIKERDALREQLAAMTQVTADAAVLRSAGKRP